MSQQEFCKNCGGKLVKKETARKATQLKQVYYYTAYFFCLNCKKIYHDDRFKVVNSLSGGLFGDTDSGSRTNGSGGRKNDRLESDSKIHFNKDQEYDVEIWTDGACVFNGHVNARAAWAFVSEDVEKAGLVPGPKQTNNVAEGLAVLRAIEWALENSYKRIKIYSDSQITINNLKKPARVIKQNKEIFEKIERIIQNNKMIVTLEKVLGHSGDINNTRADRLANKLAGKDN